MRTPLPLIAFVVSLVAASAQTQGPFQSTSNISADIRGGPDTRPGGWGLHKAEPVRLKITAPAGYRVRILEVTGDLVAWPKNGTIQPGQYAEVGWGLNTSLNDGSRFMSYPDDPAAIAYDNCIIWVQDVLTSGHGTVRVPFDRKYSNVFLNNTGVFYTQPFVALNTSGMQIHLEPTVTVTYQFEKVAPAK